MVNPSVQLSEWLSWTTPFFWLTFYTSGSLCSAVEVTSWFYCHLNTFSSEFLPCETKVFFLWDRDEIYPTTISHFSFLEGGANDWLQDFLCSEVWTLFSTILLVSLFCLLPWLSWVVPDFRSQDTECLLQWDLHGCLRATLHYILKIAHPQTFYFDHKICIDLVPTLCHSWWPPPCPFHCGGTELP